jgi:hypothetical protein
MNYVIAAICGGLATLLALLIIERFRTRTELRQRRLDYANRYRAPIVHVGKIATDFDGTTRTYGFGFEKDGRAAAQGFGIDGQRLVFGWEERELFEIAQRRAEFVEQ